MKKSLIALAALASVAGVAQAQSSVEMYGLFDIGLNQLSATKTGVADASTTTVGSAANGSTSGNGSGNYLGSRLGLRATEDLGAGNKAGFVYEMGLNLTTDGKTGTDAVQQKGYTSSIANVRQGYVFLDNSGLGRLSLGTQYSPVDASGGATASLSAHGGVNHLQGAATLLKLGQMPRFANSVMYTSPTYNGVTVRAMWNASESVHQDGLTSAQVAAKGGNATSFGIDYAAGNFKGGIATEKFSHVATDTPAALATYTGTTAITTVVNIAGAATSSNTQTYTVATANYDFGVANVGVQHANYKLTPTSGTGEVKHDVNMISATIPFAGKFSLRPAYATGKVDYLGTKAYNTSGIDLGLWYDLSKRTNLYVSWNEQKFDGKSGAVVSNVSDDGKTIKQDSVAVGVIHRF